MITLPVVLAGRSFHFASSLHGNIALCGVLADEVASQHAVLKHVPSPGRQVQQRAPAPWVRPVQYMDRDEYSYMDEFHAPDGIVKVLFGCAISSLFAVLQKRIDVHQGHVNILQQ